MKRTRRHALGQHFLVNRSVLDKIVRTIDPVASDVIVEIGPGKGALTFRLAERAGRVIAIEKDAAFIPLLREKAGPNVTIVEADVLDTDFAPPPRRRGRGRQAARSSSGTSPIRSRRPSCSRPSTPAPCSRSASSSSRRRSPTRVCGRPGHQGPFAHVHPAPEPFRGPHRIPRLPGLVLPAAQGRFGPPLAHPQGRARFSRSRTRRHSGSSSGRPSPTGGSCWPKNLEIRAASHASGSKRLMPPSGSPATPGPRSSAERLADLHRASTFRSVDDLPFMLK